MTTHAYIVIAGLTVPDKETWRYRQHEDQPGGRASQDLNRVQDWIKQGLVHCNLDSIATWLTLFGLTFNTIDLLTLAKENQADAELCSFLVYELSSEVVHPVL